MSGESLKFLFIGDSWQGASDRSLREALQALPGVSISDICSDHYLPRYRSIFLRGLNRILKPLQINELEMAIRQALATERPDAVIVYKGAGLNFRFIQEIKSRGLSVVNIFPDHSPNTYGRELQLALGYYDLIISTKPHHPKLWLSLYGYSNPCIHVPHGYDPEVHYWPKPAASSNYDVAMCATWRPEYHRLMLEFAFHVAEEPITVAIAGGGWSTHASKFPASWSIMPGVSGRAYGEFLRSAKIVIAPVNRDVVFNGKQQPGDQDTTRSYELSAMHCFFLHQRTEYIQSVYDEDTEVPFWDDSEDLAKLIRRWLPDDAGREIMSRRSHARAVPAYSIPERAKRIREILSKLGGQNSLTAMSV